MNTEGLRKKKEKDIKRSDHSLAVDSDPQNIEAHTFDSLQTALLQSLKVGDDEVLITLFATEVNPGRLRIGRRDYRQYSERYPRRSSPNFGYSAIRQND